MYSYYQLTGVPSEIEGFGRFALTLTVETCRHFMMAECTAKGSQPF
jgi:hypothetical protein